MSMKRRTVKDADAEIVTLKRELIEARTQMLTLTGQVTRLEEQLVKEKYERETNEEIVEAACKALGGNAMPSNLVDEVTELRRLWEASPEQSDLDAEARRADEAEENAAIEREEFLRLLGLTEHEWRCGVKPNRGAK